MSQPRWQQANGRAAGDATAIFRHLEHLRSQDELTPDLIIADSRKTSSPLHRYFEWDNARAGHRFRRYQVSGLMAKLVIVNGDEVRRAYGSVKKKGDSPRHFDLMTRVLKNPEQRRPFARRALLQLANWERRYKDFPELQASLAAVKSALRRVIRPALEEMEEANV